jgi:hypothetical protein
MYNQKMKLTSLIQRLVLGLTMLLSTQTFGQGLNNGQILLNSITGSWHSVRGYIVNDNYSSCYTTQPVYINNNGGDLANFSYSISCSNGYQVQMQGLDFNPKVGSYNSGYNRITSQYLYNNSTIVGIERKMTTTWGFGSMINFQYQTVRMITNPGSEETLTLEISNSQSNVQNGQVTTYHFDLVKN